MAESIQPLIFVTSNVKAIRVGRAPIFKMKLLQRIAWNKLTVVLMAIVAKGTEGDNITIS